MMLKDMRLSQSTAADVSTVTPIAAQAAALYQAAVDEGYGGKDFSFIFNVISGRIQLHGGK